MTEDRSAQEDQQLMARIAMRDADAFRQLADRHMQRAMRFTQRMTGNRQQAEDIVQEAFEVIWKQAPDWRPDARFTSWFHRVLLNLTYQRFRDRHRFYHEIDMGADEDSDTAEQTLIAAQEQRDIQSVLDTMPERQRVAITLFYLEELSQREACEIMEISEGALESLLSRGRAFLRRRLKSPHHH